MRYIDKFEDLVDKINKLLRDNNPIKKDVKIPLATTVAWFYKDDRKNPPTLSLRLQVPRGLNVHERHYSPLEFDLNDSTASEIHGLLMQMKEDGVNHNFGQFNGELIVPKGITRIFRPEPATGYGEMSIGDKTYDVEFIDSA